MIPRLLKSTLESKPARRLSAYLCANPRTCLLAVVSAGVIAFVIAPVAAQVITINTKTNGPVATPEGQVDRRYAQITPTSVELQKNELDGRTRLELIRALQSEQGFAMRPFPRGHKGLTLVANGKLEPAGEGYLNMVIANGLSAKPGDRVVITDVKFDKDKMIFELNGGPDLKHRFLRHIEIGGDPNYTNPVIADDGQQPTGARLTLDFHGRIPELTGKQVKDLLAPLISFDVKTPIQAFTDTLPPVLKQAILDHHVMVGMSTDMVMFAKGKPRTKTREMEGQMPFEEWIYGAPPDEVDFVRINGNRVIRVEVAKVGEPPVIYDKDEVSGLMRTDGSPVVTAENHVHIEKEGDVQRDPDRQAPAPPPSLRQRGDPLPQDQQNSKDSRVGVMRPVQFPKQKQPGDNPDSVPENQGGQQGTDQQSSSAPSASGQNTPANSQAAPTNGQAAPVDNSDHPAPPKPPSPADGTGQPN